MSGVNVKIGLFTILALLSGCDSRPNHWEAWIYPDGDNESKAFIIEGFVNFDTCRAASIEILGQMDATREGYYECGYKCGPNPKYGGMRICKETRE